MSENIIKDLKSISEDFHDYLKGTTDAVSIDSLPLSKDYLTASQDSSYNIPVQKVADWFICRSNSVEGDGITNLKMQKLLYYAQGTSMEYTGRKLFDEGIEAWEHGTLIPSVYKRFKKYERNPITEKVSPPQLSSDVEAILESTFEEYGQYSAWKLVEMVHNEMPWRSTARNCIIPDDKIYEQDRKSVV